MSSTLLKPLPARTPSRPPTWPILAALALVVLLMLALVAVDLLVAAGVGGQTADIVDNALRSVELVDDLRAETHALGDAAADSARSAAVMRRIDATAAAYDPLANYPVEREEWQRLQRTLARLREAVALRAPDAALAPMEVEAGASIDRLVDINRAAASASAARIRALHRRALWADAAVGVVIVGMGVAVALVLLQLMRRQRELSERQIELLADRNRELDAFAGRAAHDLRGPLNPIRGYADLIIAGVAHDDVSIMAWRIRRAVDRMVRIIEEMLELSRAGRPGRGSASPRLVCEELFEEMAADLHEVRVDQQLTDTPVGCDAGALGQIVRNLVTNALKFRSHERPLELRVGAVAHGDGVALTVEDNGLGMDQETAAHAFEPHYRGAHGRESPGHGLGLAIVERIASALGGSVAIQSAPDRGTRVTVHLPRAGSEPRGGLGAAV